MAKLTPFASPEFDALADRMDASRFMRRDVHRRYYKTRRGIAARAKSSSIIFGAGLYSIMSPEQRLAVTAHEFVHIRERDFLRNFVYLHLPLAVAWGVIAGVAVQSSLSFGIVLSIILIPLAFFYGPFGLRLLAAKHYRAVETRCDMVAAQYVDGEALISALYLVDPLLNPPSVRSTRKYRVRSKLYPTLEERAGAIRRVRVVLSDDHDGHV